jgi:very-short-patch-repair endonuclease
MTKRKLKIVDGQGPSRVEQFISATVQQEAVRYEEELRHAISKCESPIEELLIAALVGASKISELSLHFCLGEFSSEATFDEAAFFWPQANIGRYRVDLAIVDATLPFNHTPPRIMIVECDGHDFHEKTKDQARRDKQRDRFFQSKGYKVLRYAGSEIWADPEKCADEIIDELAKWDSWRNREK